MKIGSAPFKFETSSNSASRVSHSAAAGLRQHLVSKHSWQTHPSGESEALYIGGNTGRSARFSHQDGRSPCGCAWLLYQQTGHHSGGQSIHRWCWLNDINPLDLYIAWVDGSECHRCLENRTYRDLNPALNRVVPAKCTAHG